MITRDPLSGANMPTSPIFLADFSLALINRTGAYHVCRDIVTGLPQHFAAVRYWRLLTRAEPQGLARKLIGRAMLAELRALSGSRAFERSRAGRSKVLFLDPLYVLRTQLRREDVVLCHDVGPITHLDLFDAATTELYRRAYDEIRKARPGVVFVSEASKAEFVRLYGDDYRFLEVIPLYVRAAVQDADARPPAGLTKPFLLTVGGLEKRKNHARIIAAFQASGLRERGYSYVFCGPRGNNAQEVEQLAAATPGVHGFGYLSDAEVRWLYRNAEGFVLPSLLEGFGLPPLEAAQRGLLSIVSGGGAQEEAVGAGAVLVDPLSQADIAAGMRRLADMPVEERTRRIALVKAQAENLTHARYLDSWSRLLTREAGEGGALQQPAQTSGPA